MAAETTAGDAGQRPMMIGAPAQEKDAAPESATGDKPPRPADKTTAVKKDDEPAPGLRRSFSTHLPPPAGSYGATSVLTSNLSPEMRARLRQQGYGLRARAGSDLVEILLPSALDPWTAQRALEFEFQRGFGLNFFYKLDNFFSLPLPKDKSLRGLDMDPFPVGASRGCTTERCYGRRVIGWGNALPACAEGVKIGIIDTGYDEEHPAFAKLPVKPRVVMEVANAAKAPDWHGTGIVALLAAHAESSTPGLVPNATFLIANAFFKDESGHPRTDTAHVIAALEALERHGAQIINMSLVGPKDDVVHDKIKAMARDKGVVFVAAAGNGGPAAPPGYPAAYEEVIAVTAIDDRLRAYDYANRGGYIDVAAPGVKILTAFSDRQEVIVSGTSYAAPFVTAIVAVSYNSSPLRAQIAGRQARFDPKGAILGALNIKPLGDGPRNDQYGRGLAKAPTGCTPAPQPTAGPAKIAPRAPTAWSTHVKRTSGL